MRPDAIAEVRSFVPERQFTSGAGRISNVVYRLNLGTIEFRSASGSAATQKAAPLAAGQALTVFESLGLDGVPSILAGVPQGGGSSRLIVLLEYHSGSEQVDVANTPWSISAAATVDSANDLNFVGADSDAENAGLKALLSQKIATKYPNAEQLLLAWAAEESQSGGTVGPITAAEAAAIAPPGPPAWASLPVDRRPLGDGDTPANILATMQRRALLVDVDAASRDGSSFIRILTNQGIAFTGALAGDSLYSQIYTPARGDWRLQLLRQSQTGMTLVGSVAVPDAVWSASVATLVHVGPALIARFGGTADTTLVSGVSADGVDAWLSAHAVSGTPSPEPAGSP